MSSDYGFKPVEGVNDTYICIADADTRAVMGAKTSRAANLKKRWEELMASNDGEHWPWGDPPEMVTKFLDKNLKEYMHASIAEMAEVFVHGRGMGWPSAWLLEDNPLFVGQEVSTRAVDLLEEDRPPCTYADRRLFDLHYKWVELFETLKESVAGRGYKFDEIRWALPGTTRTGVTMCNKVRDGVRHLEQIAGLGRPFDRLAEQMLAGFDAYAPRATDAVRRGPRTPSSLWKPELLLSPSDVSRRWLKSRCARVRSRVPVMGYPPTSHVKRKKAGAYLDPSWNFYGEFEFEVTCSVAAARDWHRHRAVMPWKLTVLIDEDEQLVQSPFYDMSVMPGELWEDTSQKFFEILNDDDTPDWLALHALPFGATVQLKCHGKLPALLYMLELRYGSKGANPEYKEQARQGLYSLAAVLGPSITQREQILGSLSDSDVQEWDRVKEYLSYSKSKEKDTVRVYKD